MLRFDRIIGYDWVEQNHDMEQEVQILFKG